MHYIPLVQRVCRTVYRLHSLWAKMKCDNMPCSLLLILLWPASMCTYMIREYNWRHTHTSQGRGNALHSCWKPHLMWNIFGSTPATHHCNVDVGQGEMVDHKVWSDLNGHAGHGQRILPETGVLEDVSQADEGDILWKKRHSEFLQPWHSHSNILGREGEFWNPGTVIQTY